jgi:translocation and assembly module TamB
MAAGLGTAPLQQQLARAVGVDQITYAPSTDGAQGGVVAVSKRLSDKVYVSTQHSLSTATNTLRVSYQLSRRWSLRTESGVTDAVDLFFTLSFD